MTTITRSQDLIHAGEHMPRPSLTERVGSFFARSRAERQLSQLDDRLLADIGLRRSDIHKMVWGR